MKLQAFSVIALAPAAILISQGAHAQSNMDCNGQGEQTAEQCSAADANAARFKEGAANLFSFGKKLVNQGVDAAKSGAATLNEKAQAAQSPSPDAGSPAANTASSPSLALQASGQANSQGTKIAKPMLDGFVPRRLQNPRSRLQTLGGQGQIRRKIILVRWGQCSPPSKLKPLPGTMPLQASKAPTWSRPASPSTASFWPSSKPSTPKAAPRPQPQTIPLPLDLLLDTLRPERELASWRWPPSH